MIEEQAQLGAKRKNPQSPLLLSRGWYQLETYTILQPKLKHRSSL